MQGQTANQAMTALQVPSAFVRTTENKPNTGQEGWIGLQASLTGPHVDLAQLPGTAGKQPSETVDTMEFAWCPRMARLTLTVTTDMLVKTSGAESQAVRVWAKQWSFTASGGADETSGCIVSDPFLSLRHTHLEIAFITSMPSS